MCLAGLAAVPAGHSAKSNNLESNCGSKSQETSQTFRISFQTSVNFSLLIVFC